MVSFLHGFNKIVSPQSGSNKLSETRKSSPAERGNEENEEKAKRFPADLKNQYLLE